MKIAHFSDIHFCHPSSLSDLNFKSFLGMLNWYASRKHNHNYDRFDSACSWILEQRPDLVIISGDLTQLGKQSEMKAGMEKLDRFRSSDIPVLLIPGNHDYYSGRLPNIFTTHIKILAGSLNFPEDNTLEFDDCSISILNQSIPTPAFQAYGKIDLGEMEQIRHELPVNKNRILVGHFPLRNSCGDRYSPSRSLHGSEQLLEFMQEYNFKAYLCGHDHHAFSQELYTGGMQFCAGSISTANGCVNIYDTQNNGVELIQQWTCS